MSDHYPSFSERLVSLLPVVLLAAVDFFLLSQQAQNRALPHLAVAVLTAQFLTLVVLLKGEICPGQRGRLIQVHNGLALYWGLWFCTSFFSTYHYVPTDVLSICGLSVCYAVWKQPQDAAARQGFLTLAAAVGGLGLMCYGMLLWALPTGAFLPFNPFAQLIGGVIFAQLILNLARSRLQGWLALFPFFTLVALVLNAVAVLVYLALCGMPQAGQSAVGFEGVLAYGIYFAVHVAMALVLLFYGFRQQMPHADMLLILLFMAISLPVWATLAASLGEF